MGPSSDDGPKSKAARRVSVFVALLGVGLALIIGALFADHIFQPDTGVADIDDHRPGRDNDRSVISRSLGDVSKTRTGATPMNLDSIYYGGKLQGFRVRFMNGGHSANGLVDGDLLVSADNARIKSLPQGTDADTVFSAGQEITLVRNGQERILIFRPG